VCMCTKKFWIYNPKFRIFRKNKSFLNSAAVGESISVQVKVTKKSGDNIYLIDIHGSVRRRRLSRNTKKMQLCNKIYYFEVYWRLNIFRAAHRSSSGALNSICSVWFIYPCGDRSLPWLNGKFPTQPWQRTITTWVYKAEVTNTD
jgi:hypothetical protein